MRQSPLIEKASLHCYEKLIGTQTLEKRISLEKYSQAHPCEGVGVIDLVREELKLS